MRRNGISVISRARPLGQFANYHSVTTRRGSPTLIFLCLKGLFSL